MARKYKHIDTQLVHAGEPEPRIEGAVMMPVFQSSTFLSDGSWVDPFFFYIATGGE